jgi:hypothetical protein
VANVIATKRRTVSENGLVKIPISSTGSITGAATMARQESRICVTNKLLPFTGYNEVNTASVNVTAMLPVRFAEPGNIPRGCKQNKEEKRQHVACTFRSDARYLASRSHRNKYYVSSMNDWT